MSFSVIIPTMWRKTDYLLAMLDLYDYSKLVGEVLLIDNEKGFDRKKLEVFKKVVILNNGENLFVNPSWNLGVSKAKNDKIILANDDIFIADVECVLHTMYMNLREGQIIGIGKNCFEQKRTKELGKLRIIPVDRREYGFGVFMALLKESYVEIPDQLKVWYGDTLLSIVNKPFVVEGIDVKTNMRETSKTLELNKQRIREKMFFQKLII